jgi:hypothetical protein
VSKPIAHAFPSYPHRRTGPVPVSTDTARRESQSEEYVPASSFTPINRPAKQLLTPQSSIFTPATMQSRQANHGRQRGKQHHPTRAEYMDLGVEPSPLESYALALPLTPSSPPRSRKRSRKMADGNRPADGDTENTKPSKQRRRSSDLRVTKPVARKSLKNTDTTTFSGSASCAELSGLRRASRNIDMSPPAHDAAPHPTKHTQRKKQPYDHSQAAPNETLNALSSSCTISSSTAQDLIVACDLEDDHLLNLDSQDTIADDEIDDIFNMIDLHNASAPCATNSKPQIDPMRPQRSKAEVDIYNRLNLSEDDFGDEDLFALTTAMTNSTSSPSQPTSMSPNAVEEPCPSQARYRFRKFVSPPKSRTKALIQKPAASSEEERKPIVRPPFPAPVRDRSPIIGLSRNLMLRTCFRIGEAINQANHAAKHGQKTIFELYARVLTCQRNEAKQDFVFRDLFHEKPPYIKGVYDAVIWKSVRLYEYDSERLLEKGRICRCVGTIKRDGREWVMMVLNAWEARWEDISWVEGIVKT